MKHTKRGITVLLVLALTLTLVTAASLNWTNTALGDLSQYYETGSVGQEKAKPGYISEVKGDSGGKSYGIYMFASKPDTPYAFAKWLASYPIGSVYKTMGDTLVEAYELNAAGERVSGYGDNFDAKWESIAKMYHSEFYAAQKEYWETTSYANLIKNIKAQYPAFDMNNYSMALQNVFWSRSVQHGAGKLSGADSSDGMSGATGVIVRAINSLGEFKNQSEEELIAAIYAECSKLDATPRTNKMTDAVAYKYGVGGQSMAYYYGNSGDVQISVYRRLHVNEPADATVMLYQKSSYTMPNGTYQILERENNQSRAISGGALKTAAEADSFKLTNYNGGYVTLSVGDKRLTDNGGTVSMTAASADNNQMWTITTRDAGGFLLQNRSTGKYLSLNDSGAVVTVDSAESAAAWQISAQATVSTAGLFYPGCEKDRTNTLVAGNSSYPVRGVLTCAKPMTNVTVAVKTSSGAAAFTPAASGTINANWYDLWELDSKCTFSKLTAGDYTLTVTATVDGIPVEVAKSNFTVSQNTGGKVDDETYTVTLDAAGGTCAKTSVTYKLGEVYGELPEVKKDGYEFQGWFLADGSQATPSTPVAAKNHTLTAKYGDLYTVKFLGADGSTLKTLKLAKGELITAPTNPIKAADSQYTYNFDRWEDGNGNKFTAAGTYVGESNITYTPIFTKSERSTGGGTTPPSGGGTTPPSGGGTTPPTTGGGTTPPTTGGTYLTGITPNTGVSALTGAGYTVYSGSKQVTSGNIATGMTAVTGSTSVTIVVTGDANGDGKLTITDVVKLQSHVVGKSSLSGAYAKAADINGDGKVTITDVVQAAQVTVGKRSLS